MNAFSTLIAHALATHGSNCARSMPGSKDCLTDTNMMYGISDSDLSAMALDIRVRLVRSRVPRP